MARYDNIVRPSTVRQVLEAERVEDLRTLARLVTRSVPTRKGELVDVVVAYLADPAHLREVLDGLDAIARSAVAEAAYGSGSLSPPAFRAKYGALPRRTGWLTALFDVTLFMPPDLGQRVRALVPRPPDVILEGVEELPAGDDMVMRLGEIAAQADLLAVLRLCDTGRLTVSQATRRPSQATVRAVAEVLEEGDFYPDEAIAAFAWPLLLQAGGLAALAAGRLALSANGRKALAAAPHDTLASLWRRWLKGGLIDEFSRVEAIKGQQAAGGRNLTAPAPRRAALAAALAEAPPGRWVQVDAFFRYMRACGHDFTVARDLWRLYITDPQYGSLGYDGGPGWSLMEGRFALCLLFEYAAVLGLIDVAYERPEGARDDYRDRWGTDELDALSRYDGLRYFRLNALGAYALGLSEAYAGPAGAPSQAGALRVLPNLEVVFLGARVAAHDALCIERYGEPRSAGVWALSKAKLLQALERDGNLADLEALLARTEGPLPDTVRSLLGEVRERSARLRDLGTYRLIECADADLARLLAHDRRLRGRATLVGERHLAVPLSEETAFRRALHTAGYALSAGAGAAQPAPARSAAPAPDARAPSPGPRRR